MNMLLSQPFREPLIAHADGAAETVVRERGEELMRPRKLTDATLPAAARRISQIRGAPPREFTQADVWFNLTSEEAYAFDELVYEKVAEILSVGGTLPHRFAARDAGLCVGCAITQMYQCEICAKIARGQE